MTQAISIKKRGCLWPIAGGTYAFVDPEKIQDASIWQFIVDPTYPIVEGSPLAGIKDAPVSMVLMSRGQVNKQGQEIYDIYDWIGSHHYPNVLDWLLEVQQLGFHQKMNPTDIQWLTPESYYFAVHERAAFMDPSNVYSYRELFPHPHQPKCPGNVESHISVDLASDLFSLGTCVGLFFNDVIKGKKENKESNVVIREMPSFSWDGFEAVDGHEHQPAIFFRLPIGHLAQFLVYEDAQEATHEDALAELEKLDAKMKRVKLVKLE